MRLILNLLVLALLVGSFQSCVSKKKYDELLAAKDATDQSLAATQATVQDLEAQNAEIQSDLEETTNRLNSEIESVRSDLNEAQSEMQAVSQKLNMTQDELDALVSEVEGSFSTFENSGLSVESRDGKMYVMTSTPMQYRSGSWRLTSEERAAIGELAEILKSNPDLKILVEGHADSQQYPADSGMDNWQLSVNRAMGVVRQLLSDGVNADQVAAVGYGDARPTASNDSEEGRAENRRSMVRPEFEVQKILEQARTAQEAANN